MLSDKSNFKDSVGSGSVLKFSRRRKRKLSRSSKHSNLPHLNLFFNQLTRAMELACEGRLYESERNLRRLNRAISKHTKPTDEHVELYDHLEHAVISCRAYITSYNPVFLVHAQEEISSAKSLCGTET